MLRAPLGALEGTILENKKRNKEQLIALGIEALSHLARRRSGRPPSRSTRASHAALRTSDREAQVGSKYGSQRSRCTT
jgi:hypothetical protein